MVSTSSNQQWRPLPSLLFSYPSSMPPSVQWKEQADLPGRWFHNHFTWRRLLLTWMILLIASKGANTHTYLAFNPNHPVFVCVYMIQILVHTWRGRGYSIFIEINVKRQSNQCPSKCAAFKCAQYIFSPAKLFQIWFQKVGIIYAQQPG